MIVRAAGPEDAGAIWRILEPTIRAGETYPLPRDMGERDALAYWFNPGHAAFVAEDAGRVVGTYYLRANTTGAGPRLSRHAVQSCDFDKHAGRATLAGDGFCDRGSPARRVPAPETRLCGCAGAVSDFVRREGEASSLRAEGEAIQSRGATLDCFAFRRSRQKATSVGLAMTVQFPNASSPCTSSTSRRRTRVSTARRRRRCPACRRSGRGACRTAG